ncbi:MAG TPA: hypothetical protein VHS78_17815 [Candidatus Elarobacter sp.]|jgi:hypothetical protein|nr:hypothetical protein [Candidatus Elarobacter sp.]
MQLLDSFFGRREQRWFENGAAGARRGKFQGHAVSDGRKIPLLGTAVSREGVAFFAPHQLAESELHITFVLRERTIPSRVHVDQCDAMQAPDRVVHRYFCSFTAIAADDWDAVVRYVENKPEPPKLAVVPKNDDEFRALPVLVQDAIVEQLVRAKRLNAPAPGTVPLIRMSAGGMRDVGHGRTAQDVLIHSRAKVGDSMHAYDTRFRVFSSQRVELIA